MSTGGFADSLLAGESRTVSESRNRCADSLKAANGFLFALRLRCADAPFAKANEERAVRTTRRTKRGIPSGAGKRAPIGAVPKLSLET